MTLADSPVRPRPASGEAPFEFGEIFYSRTDDRGVIQSGNEVFRRVADYDWDRMLGAPHRIIRHPDMPKAVFWLLWDRIKRGLPTGAYVKNRARDGLHYWVYAVITPLDGGYLSVRIKPSSNIFDRAKALYAEILAREAEGMPPAESAALMAQLLQERGFADYDEFMGVALFNELAARDKTLNRRPAQRVSHVAEMHSNLRVALREKLTLLRSFEEIRAIPTNLHIVASRLEVYGGPVSTIAENYRLMSAEVIRRLEEMAGHGDRIAPVPGRIGGPSRQAAEVPAGQTIGDQLQATVSSGLFLAGATMIFAETERSCREMAPTAGIDPAVEAANLRAVDADYRRKALVGLGGVSRSASALSSACEDLKRLMLGLDSIRVLCRVEAGRMPVGSDGLQAIIATLDRFHADVGQRLEKILDLARRIQNSAESAVKADS